MPHRPHSSALAIAVLLASTGCGKDGGDDSQEARTGAEEAGEAAGTEATIRVTGIPDENPTALARQYQPMVDLLEEKLGAEVEYVPVTDYGAAVQALIAGKVDFAWLGGFTHVQARDRADVVPLVMRDIDREFHSVFVAHADSAIESPEDLGGKTFAFGSKSSTSGHLMPRHFLATEFGIDPDGDFDGDPVFSGALNEQVWDRMVEEGKVDTDRVKVVWTTPPYVDYVWTARTAVPESTRTAFAEAFLDLDADDPDHAKVLDRMGADEYVPASPEDFDAIENVARSVGMLK